MSWRPSVSTLTGWMIMKDCMYASRRAVFWLCHVPHPQPSSIGGVVDLRPGQPFNTAGPDSFLLRQLVDHRHTSALERSACAGPPPHSAEQVRPFPRNSSMRWIRVNQLKGQVLADVHQALAVENHLHVVAVEAVLAINGHRDRMRRGARSFSSTGA